MTKGLESILKRIRENPGNRVLVTRFLALVAETGDSKSKFRLLLGLADAIREADPLDAMRIAYIVFQRDRTQLIGLEIMVDSLKAMGRFGKAEVISLELTKLRQKGEGGRQFASEDTSRIDIVVGDVEKASDRLPRPPSPALVSEDELAKLRQGIAVLDGMFGEGRGRLGAGANIPELGLFGGLHAGPDYSSGMPTTPNVPSFALPEPTGNVTAAGDYGDMLGQPPETDLHQAMPGPSMFTLTQVEGSGSATGVPHRDFEETQVAVPFAGAALGQSARELAKTLVAAADPAPPASRDFATQIAVLRPMALDPPIEAASDPPFALAADISEEDVTDDIASAATAYRDASLNLGLGEGPRAVANDDAARSMPRGFDFDPVEDNTLRIRLEDALADDRMEVADKRAEQAPEFSDPRGTVVTRPPPLRTAAPAYEAFEFQDLMVSPRARQRSGAPSTFTPGTPGEQSAAPQRFATTVPDGAAAVTEDPRSPRPEAGWREGFYDEARAVLEQALRDARGKVRGGTRSGVARRGAREHDRPEAAATTNSVARANAAAIAGRDWEPEAFWEPLVAWLKPGALSAHRRGGRDELELIRGHLIAKCKSHGVALPVKALGRIAALLTKPLGTNQAAGRYRLTEALWEELGPKGVPLVLASAGLESAAPMFWGVYLDQLVGSGRARRALHEVRRGVDLGSSLEWVMTAMEHLPDIWERLHLRGFYWRKEEGVQNFIMRLAKREEMTLAHLIAAGE